MNGLLLPGARGIYRPKPLGGDGGDGVFDIGALDLVAGPSEAPEEFDVAGATYFAVAPAGYTYSAEQTTNYSTRKYNTLAAAEAALNTTPSNEVQVINIIGDWTGVVDTTNCNFLTMTQASVLDNIIVRAIGDARHNGVWADSASSTFYRIRAFNPNGAVGVWYDYLELDGFIIEAGTPSSNERPVFKTNVGTGGERRVFKNLILKGHGSGTYRQHGMDLTGLSATGTTYIFNNLIYNIPTLNAGQGITFEGTNGCTYYAYSNTVIGGQYAMREDTATTLKVLHLKNNYAGGALTSAYSGSFDTFSKCAADDTTASEVGLQSVPLSTATFTNVTSGSEDFTPAVGSTLIGAGTDTTGESSPLNFTDDASSRTR